VGSQLLPVALVALVVLVGASALLQIWFIAELKRLDPRAWRLVAEPAWLRWGSGAAVRFIQTGRYRQLQSPKLRRFGAVLRMVQLSALLLFFGLLLYALSALWRDA